jgi:hypothetical protein
VIEGAEQQDGIRASLREAELAGIADRGGGEIIAGFLGLLDVERGVASTRCTV